VVHTRFSLWQHGLAKQLRYSLYWRRCDA
jgi:hypothetical protein